jgi:hypothetical protein
MSKRLKPSLPQDHKVTSIYKFYLLKNVCCNNEYCTVFAMKAHLEMLTGANVGIAKEGKYTI